jgi:hypothetical protein
LKSVLFGFVALHSLTLGAAISNLSVQPKHRGRRRWNRGSQPTPPARGSSTPSPSKWALRSIDPAHSPTIPLEKKLPTRLASCSPPSPPRFLHRVVVVYNPLRRACALTRHLPPRTTARPDTGPMAAAASSSCALRAVASAKPRSAAAPGTRPPLLLASHLRTSGAPASPLPSTDSCAWLTAVARSARVAAAAKGPARGRLVARSAVAVTYWLRLPPPVYHSPALCLVLICACASWVAVCRPRRTRRPRRLDPSQAGKILTCLRASVCNPVTRLRSLPHNTIRLGLDATRRFNFRCI